MQLTQKKKVYFLAESLIFNLQKPNKKNSPAILFKYPNLMLIGLRTCHRGHFVHPSFGILETNIYMRVCDDSVLQGGGNSAN